MTSCWARWRCRPRMRPVMATTSITAHRSMTYWMISARRASRLRAACCMTSKRGSLDWIPGRSTRSNAPTSTSCATRSALRVWNSMRSRATVTIPPRMSNCWATACTRPMCCTMHRRAERYRHIINRLNKVPELIRQAEANLQDSPEVWNQVAREENTGQCRSHRHHAARRLSARRAHALRPSGGQRHCGTQRFQPLAGRQPGGEAQ